ncbi:F-box/FBD/LRR-repeat protein At2g04230-like [Panicum hallii]|uniref:F-box/FBD/LRR-repeat protein At2g04230-like n=1 Tax=Panicum hallii TaxID=206008 RepID=UPI000DF4E60A|nr:F-box/FBD/LRR-repeat protein At2g04230-like [Panicum hallii]
MEDLPEEIKPRVMSLLSLKEAARTSTVATNWRSLWTCYPNLCFDGSSNVEESTDEDDDSHSGTGLDKFSIIKYSLKTKSRDHLGRWIRFATGSKAKAIDVDLWAKRERVRQATQVYNFPLEALRAQEGPFIRSLSLKYVSMKPHSEMMCGFTKLRRLLLHSVRIVGDLPGLLNGCWALEDQELIKCYGVADLNVPCRLDKLRRLVISQTPVHMVGFHVTGLTQFEFNGDEIPIALHGCSKLEKATIDLGDASVKQKSNRALCYAFTEIPGISAVRVLNLHAYMDHQRLWASQVLPLATLCN